MIEKFSYSKASLCLCFGFAFLVYQFTIALYNVYLHPLSRFPGPRFWAASRLPFVISLQSGNLVHDTKRIHDRYGKVVRLAPNELSYIDAQAWQDIYGHRKRGHKEFQKNPIWAQPTPNGAYSVINAPEGAHARIRRPLAPAFGIRAIKYQEPILQKYVDLLVKTFRKHVEKGTPVVDLNDYYSWTTFDIFGDLGFGEPFDCLQNEEYHEWVSFLFSHLKAAALLASINFYPRIKRMLFCLLPKSTFQKAMHHHNMSSAKIHRRMAMKTDRKDIISYLLDNFDGAEISVAELEATASILVLAGSESTGTGLTATTSYLIRFPEKMRKLAFDIRSSFVNEHEITLASLENMPYLNAVIQEGMRLAPPVPTSIPRIVPPEGDVVSGELLPGGTFVGVHQFAAYRSHLNFVYPDHFLPERWLAKDSPLCSPSPSDPLFTPTSFDNDEKGVMRPFSVGPRNCVGLNLALAEMRLIIARLMWNFDLRSPETSSSISRKAVRQDVMVDGLLVFEAQKTFSLWVREPCEVQIAER